MQITDGGTRLQRSDCKDAGDIDLRLGKGLLKVLSSKVALDNNAIFLFRIMLI
jgi:hypothetical protein